MDSISPSINRLPLAQPSLLMPKGGLFVTLSNKHRKSWIHPESSFEQALRLYWANTRSSRTGIWFGIDPLVIPYLNHFCAVLRTFSRSTSLDLLCRINPSCDSAKFDTNSLLFSICIELLLRIEDERSPSCRSYYNRQERRFTTNLEVKNQLLSSIKGMIDSFAKELLLSQVEGPLEIWRFESMKLFAHAASINNFGDSCQDIFDRYLQNSCESILDAKARVNIGLLSELEGRPEISLNRGARLSFRCEVLCLTRLYADNHTDGEIALVPYTAYSPLQCAIESYTMSHHPIPSLIGKFPEDIWRVCNWSSKLTNYFNFDQHSAEQLLKQVHYLS